MRQRSFIVVAVAIAVLIVGAVGVYAYDQTQTGKIAKGVTAGGVDLSGMKPAKARQTLQRQLADPLNQPVSVRYAGHRYAISARRAGVHVDIDAMVQDALTASRKGSIISRTTRAITGGSVHATIPVAITYSHAAVARFAAKVKRHLDRPAQDASIDFTGGSIQPVDSKNGRSVDTAALERQVSDELVQPTADHRLKAPVNVVKPKTTTRELAKRYPRVITINRSAFRLTLYDHLKVAKTYTIAVGRQGLETPAGEYPIQDKQVNPSWHVPNSAWAGKLAGQVIPPGPADPIKARWMGISGGAGIHGTEDVGSLGSAASHGCIRMAIPDVIQLFDQVSVGDPVFIS
jgi:lipoprotein-anchoring transpeptidase ErfK/SrfK